MWARGVRVLQAVREPCTTIVVQGWTGEGSDLGDLRRIELDHQVRREGDGGAIVFASGDDRARQEVALGLHVPRVVAREPEAGSMGHRLQVGERLVRRDDPPGIRGNERLLVGLGPGAAEGSTVAVEDRRLDPAAPLPLDAVDGAGSEVAQANAEGVLPGIGFADQPATPVAHRPALLPALVEGDGAPGSRVSVDPEGRAALDDLELAALARGGGGGGAGGDVVDFHGHRSSPSGTNVRVCYP